MAKKRQTNVEYINTTLMTDAVEIHYVYLGKPDEAFGKSQYKVSLVGIPKDLLDKMLKIENEHRKSKGMKSTTSPKWLVSSDDGTTKVCFKSARQPTVVDAKVQPMDPNTVFSGSIAKLQIQPAWVETGVYTGMVWYLNAVQVLKKGAGFGNVLFSVEADYLDNADSLEEEAPFNVEDIDSEIELDEEDLLV